MARTSTTVLNRNGERMKPCLVPDFSGKSFNSHHCYVGCGNNVFQASERDLERKGKGSAGGTNVMVCTRAKPCLALYILSHPDFIINPHSGLVPTPNEDFAQKVHTEQGSKKKKKSLDGSQAPTACLTGSSSAIV